MRILLIRFFRQSSGAVSAELVVLAAASLAMTVAVLSTLNNQAGNVGDQVGQVVATRQMGVDGDTR